MTTASNPGLVHGVGCALLAIVGLLPACGNDGTGSDSATDGTGTTPGTATGSSSGTDGTGSASATDTSQPTTGGSVSASQGDTTTGTSEPGTSTGALTTEGPDTTQGVDSTSTTDESTGSSTGDDPGPKLDMMDDTTTGVPVQPGSCRPSEIYGASGGFPAFVDPAYKNFLEKKIAVMTSNSQQDGWVLHVIDISGAPPPPNMNYNAPKYHNAAWQQNNIGRVFGLTLDSNGNIYVAPTTVYGANPSPATIKRIDSKTGLVSNFATLPNNGPALGNLNYDCISETIYASNHEDGRIYQIDMAGQIVSTYRHSDKDVTMGPAQDPGEPNGQFVPLGQRVWAVQSHAGRLYYSVWKEDTGRKSPDSNEIWSVGYTDEKGVPDPATAKLEFLVPAYLGQDYSNPVADISFAATGWMLISQRTMINDNQTSAHQSTTYEFQSMGGVWVNKGTTFIVGELPGSAAGGVDHDFDEGGYVWMSGDALDFYTPDVVYGLQGTPHAGGDIKNSTLIDLDGEVTQQDKTAMGDVELPIPGDAMPVPEPQ